MKWQHMLYPAIRTMPSPHAQSAHHLCYTLRGRMKLSTRARAGSASTRASSRLWYVDCMHIGLSQQT